MALLCLAPLLAEAALSVPPGGVFTLPPGGRVDLACTNLDVQGSLSLGDGEIDQTADVGIGDGGVLDGGSGTLHVGGNWTNVGTFIAGTGTVIFQDGCGTSPALLSGNTTFHDLTLASGTGRTFVLPTDSPITVLGTLTLLGVDGAPIQLVSSSTRIATVHLGPDAQLVSIHATVTSNVRIGAADATPQAIPALGHHGLTMLALLLAALAAWQFSGFPFAGRKKMQEIKRRLKT